MDLRKLDALVAEKVMGEKLFDSTIPAKDELGRFVDRGIFPQTVPNYSTEIAAAWEVVEACKSLHIISRNNDEPNDWIIGAYDPDRVLAKTSTAPLAICLAALKSKGIDVSEWEK